MEKRASLIPGEYKRPLADLDTRYHRVEEGQTGPLVRRLERFGNILTWWWAPGKRRARICMTCLTSLPSTRWQCLAWPEVERQQKTNVPKFCRDTATLCQQRRQEQIQLVFIGQACQGGRGCRRRGELTGEPMSSPEQRSDLRRVCLCCVNCNHYCNLSTFL